MTMLSLSRRLGITPRPTRKTIPLRPAGSTAFGPRAANRPSSRSSGPAPARSGTASVRITRPTPPDRRARRDPARPAPARLGRLGRRGRRGADGAGTHPGRAAGRDAVERAADGGEAGRRLARHLRPVRLAHARPGRAAARLARRTRSRRGRPGAAAAALPGRPRGHPDAPRQPRAAHAGRPERGGTGRVHHLAARHHPDGGLGDRAVHPGDGRPRHRTGRARLRRRRRRRR